MLRRTFVQAMTVGILSLAGCTDSSDEGDNSADESNDYPSAATPNEESSKRVIAEETLYSKTRYPVDLVKGVVLHFSIDVKKGTFCLVDVASTEAKENVFKKKIQTQAEFSYPIEYDGVHYVTIQGMDEANVKLWLA